MAKIWIAKSVRAAGYLADILGEPLATVEAEYGEQVVKGKYATLAHHAEAFRSQPPPCIAKLKPLPKEDGYILISHIDLDTLGGIFQLTGKKPEDEDFWQGAGFIDLHGQHYMHQLDERIQDRLNAFYAWKSRQEYRATEDVEEVTNFVSASLVIIESIIRGDSRLIEEGRAWKERITEKFETYLDYENGHLRAFRTSEPIFTAASYYSPRFKRVVEATVSQNTAIGTLTLAFEDGGKRFSAKTIMQKLFGEKAGGHPGIAGSPRDEKMKVADYERLVDLVKMLYEKER